MEQNSLESYSVAETKNFLENKDYRPSNGSSSFYSKKLQSCKHLDERLNAEYLKAVKCQERRDFLKVVAEELEELMYYPVQVQTTFEYILKDDRLICSACIDIMINFREE